MKAQHSGPTLRWTLLPRCGDACGYPADAWCLDLLLSCLHLPLAPGCCLEGSAKAAGCLLLFARDWVREM